MITRDTESYFKKPDLRSNKSRHCAYMIYSIKTRFKKKNMLCIICYNWIFVGRSSSLEYGSTEYRVEPRFIGTAIYCVIVHYFLCKSLPNIYGYKYICFKNKKSLKLLILKEKQYVFFFILRKTLFIYPWGTDHN